MDIRSLICRHFTIPAHAVYEGNSYLKDLKYLNQSQYFDPEVIKEKQWMKIKNILDHAYQNTRFYRENFDKEKINLGKVNTWNDFFQIPFLTKEEVRNHKGKMFASNYDKYIKFITSGSSGIPLEGYRNKSCQHFKQAMNVRSSQCAGYKLGERIYCLYGDPESKLTWKQKINRKFISRTGFLNTLDLSNESMMNFANLLSRKPPSLLWGHTHNMYIFANFLEKNGIENIQPKGMYSAGMVLHNYEREKVEKVFNCKFQDRYGCEEIGLIAAECKEQEGLHINTDGVYVEFVDKHGLPVSPGEPGQIVVTDLTNYFMPFIRYQMGDVGISVNKQCSCGRTQPLIKSIEGRIADFILTPEGKAISGISLTDHFGASIPGVAQIQIVQEKINFLVFNIVRDSAFDENSYRKMDNLVTTFFGKSMQYECQFVKKINREPSGKYRFTICKIENPYM
jgi:phenylacetate-coenzyme A ligase PaaK-like adenylate-forming protein